ncbi:MAG TPA: dihydropteroate synthase [Solirubrobacteraceae bacterium]|nr:dihydropteroate synthase [Solirubrobacteraceae bacterium]
MSEAASLELWPDVHERYAAAFGVDPELGRRAYAAHPAHSDALRPSRDEALTSPEMARTIPEPLVMGVVNVTPDSFSDGGAWLNADAAIAHGLTLIEQGAAILDVGGESTRPGAEPVGEGEELRRVLPVLAGLAGRGARLSIDTSKAAVAAAALDAGATIVNDVTALRGDHQMATLIAERGCDVCLMHMLGEPRTMQRDPRYGDVVEDVRAFLAERLAYAVGRGIEEQCVWLDPGIGFGKTIDHNLELLARLDEIVALGRPVVVGTSRKSFLGTITGREPGDRVPATIATNVLALAHGASIFRVHDVAQARDALLVAAATLRGRWLPTTTSTTASTTSSKTTTRRSRPS